jgi:uncharacterized membrane protein YqjE
MFQLIKYWGLILRLRDVSDIYKEEKGQGKPWYISRRFIGAVITLLGLAATAYFGVEIDAQKYQVIADNILAIITAGIALYGAMTFIVGAIGAALRKAKN